MRICSGIRRFGRQRPPPRANEAPLPSSHIPGRTAYRILDDIEKGKITKAPTRHNRPRRREAARSQQGLYGPQQDIAFAFTGNKFEFRPSARPSPFHSRNRAQHIVAESLDILARKIKTKGGNINQPFWTW
jgi:glutamine synthetase type III